MYKLYGIKNCNTVKKAVDCLTKKKITFEFVDFKKYQPTKDDIKLWKEAFGELPVNKKGLTYKKHKEVYEELTQTKKVAFIQEQTSMIKRPILVKGNKVLAFGFNEDEYKSIK